MAATNGISPWSRDASVNGQVMAQNERPRDTQVFVFVSVAKVPFWGVHMLEPMTQAS